MKSPIILTAFGTTSAANTTYEQLEKSIRTKFPENPIYWGYPLREVKKHRPESSTIRQTSDILTDLAASGHKQAIIQPLHLLPGHEFHQLHTEVRQVSAINTILGRPLLFSPDDYSKLIDLLQPVIQARSDTAILLIGHGTRHPVWPAYLALEHLLQTAYGKRVKTSVIEHYPDNTDIPEILCAADYTEVLLIPLFLIAGLHFHRDIMGDSSTSWRSRLEQRGMNVSAIETGLGLLPGFDTLLIGHIREALARLTAESLNG